MATKNNHISNCDPKQKLAASLTSLFILDGILNLEQIANIQDIEYYFALVLNNELLVESEKSYIRFGADYIQVSKIEIQNNVLNYWGKINWIKSPSNHKCYRGFKDPFYASVSIKNNLLNINKVMFGDYQINDLDNPNWMDSNIEWIYEIM